MYNEGKIAADPALALVPWEPSTILSPVSAERARYSRGFLNASPVSWFNGLAELWLPLYQTIGAEVRIDRFETVFTLPENVARSILCEIDGEPAFIAYTDDASNIIAQTVVPESDELGSDVVLEYLERRFLSTLSMGWRGSSVLSCHYRGRCETSDVNGVAFVCADIVVSGLPVSIVFAIGAGMLEALDELSRVLHVERSIGARSAPLSDQVHAVSIELAELAVPPAMLIDYMRTGTIIDLEVPVTSTVDIKVDGQLWGEGVLCRYRDSFAVEITSLEPTPREYPEATTRVRIQIAETELDESGLIEHAQPGAILLSDTAVQSHSSLIISGENVASAVVGEIDGSFALSILPK